MIVCEILDSAYEFKLTKKADGMQASFKNADGEKVIVSFIQYHIPNTGYSYEISFGIKKTGTELTGKGDEFKTFSTVVKIIDAFLEKKSEWLASGVPRLIFFTANSNERNSLYSKLMGRLMKKYPRFRKVTAETLPDYVKEWWKQLDFDGEAVQIVTDLK